MNQSSLMVDVTNAHFTLLQNPMSQRWAVYVWVEPEMTGGWVPVTLLLRWHESRIAALEDARQYVAMRYEGNTVPLMDRLDEMIATEG